MKQRIHLGAAWLAPVALALLVGCSSRHSIEPGLWKLSMEGDIYDLRVGDRKTGERMVRESNVNVVLNWRPNERTQKEEETVEIHYAGADAESKVDAEPITGIIEVREDAAPMLKVQSKTRRAKDRKEYNFELLGKIVNERFIEGTLYALEVREEWGIQGGFTLRKLNPGDVPREEASSTRTAPES